MRMGFRKGKCTRDAIFQLRMISERITQMNRDKKIKGKKKKKTKRKKMYICFVDYQKAFDRVRHDNLAELMVKAGIPDLERILIINNHTTLEGVEGIGFGGVNITNLRYGDDAGLRSEESRVGKECRSRWSP